MSLNDNLVSHYTLDTLNIIDEIGNTTLNDFQSNTPEQTTGKIGGAIKFQEDTHIAINASQEFDEAPISVGCWVKPTGDISADYDNKGILGKWGGNNQWILWTQTGGSFNPTISVVDDQNNRADIQGPTPTQGEWTHYLFTYKSDGTLKLYVDGSLEQEDTSTLNGTINSGTNDFAIGSYAADADNSNSGSGNDFNIQADIDDVKVWNRGISENEANQIVIRGNRASTNDLYKGLVGYWTLDTTDVIDSTPYKNNGTINGSVDSATGKIGGGLDFNGGPDQIEVADDDIFDITDEITITCWVKPESAPASFEKWELLVGKGGGASWNDENYMFNLNEGRPDLWWGEDHITAPNAILKGEWSHLAVTVGQSKIKLFENGVKVEEINRNNSPPANSKTLKFGYSGTQDSQFAGFEGIMDDIRIYRIEKSETEINQLSSSQARQVQRL